MKQAVYLLLCSIIVNGFPTETGNNELKVNSKPESYYNPYEEYETNSGASKAKDTQELEQKILPPWVKQTPPKDESGDSLLPPPLPLPVNSFKQVVDRVKDNVPPPTLQVDPIPEQNHNDVTLPPTPPSNDGTVDSLEKGKETNQPQHPDNDVASGIEKEGQINKPKEVVESFVERVKRLMGSTPKVEDYNQEAKPDNVVVSFADRVKHLLETKQYGGDDYNNGAAIEQEAHDLPYIPPILNKIENEIGELPPWRPKLGRHIIPTETDPNVNVDLDVQLPPWIRKHKNGNYGRAISLPQAQLDVNLPPWIRKVSKGLENVPEIRSQIHFPPWFKHPKRNGDGVKAPEEIEGHILPVSPENVGETETSLPLTKPKPKKHKKPKAPEQDNYTEIKPADVPLEKVEKAIEQVEPKVDKVGSHMFKESKDNSKFVPVAQLHVEPFDEKNVSKMHTDHPHHPEEQFQGELHHGQGNLFRGSGNDKPRHPTEGHPDIHHSNHLFEGSNSAAKQGHSTEGHPDTYHTNHLFGGSNGAAKQGHSTEGHPGAHHSSHLFEGSNGAAKQGHPTEIHSDIHHPSHLFGGSNGAAKQEHSTEGHPGVHHSNHLFEGSNGAAKQGHSAEIHLDTHHSNHLFEGSNGAVKQGHSTEGHPGTHHSNHLFEGSNNAAKPKHQADSLHVAVQPLPILNNIDPEIKVNLGAPVQKSSGSFFSAHSASTHP